MKTGRLGGERVGNDALRCPKERVRRVDPYLGIPSNHASPQDGPRRGGAHVGRVTGPSQMGLARARSGIRARARAARAEAMQDKAKTRQHQDKDKEKAVRGSTDAQV